MKLTKILRREFSLCRSGEPAAGEERIMKLSVTFEREDNNYIEVSCGNLYSAATPPLETVIQQFKNACMAAGYPPSVINRIGVMDEEEAVKMEEPSDPFYQRWQSRSLPEDDPSDKI